MADSLGDATVGVVLDEHLDFIISEEVDWMSGESGLVLLLGNWFERFDNESNFESTV